MLFFTGFQAGLSPALQAKPGLKGICLERLFDHEKVVLFHIENDRLATDAPDNLESAFHRKKVPFKRRYYLATSKQHLSHSSRIFQLPYNLEPFVPIQENKTGIYQQQHAFLPAYYNFLFRYTLF